MLNKEQRYLFQSKKFVKCRVGKNALAAGRVFELHPGIHPSKTKPHVHPDRAKAMEWLAFQAEATITWQKA